MEFCGFLCTQSLLVGLQGPHPPEADGIVHMLSVCAKPSRVSISVFF